MNIFDFEIVIFKQDINMFTRIEIAENMYEGILDLSCKNIPWKNPPMLAKSG